MPCPIRSNMTIGLKFNSMDMPPWTRRCTRASLGSSEHYIFQLTRSKYVSPNDYQQGEILWPRRHKHVDAKTSRLHRSKTIIQFGTVRKYAYPCLPVYFAPFPLFSEGNIGDRVQMKLCRITEIRGYGKKRELPKYYRMALVTGGQQGGCSLRAVFAAI